MNRTRTRDWQDLIDLTQGRQFVVERVRLAETDIAIEGKFEPPDLARLPSEDQVFVAAFIRSHGSIKEMERVFGISYPTVKSRLNRISQNLDFIDTDPAPPRSEILESLERGEITVEQAISEMEDVR
jgi:hypothetical protein